MSKNDFDIDFDFEEEYGFDPKAFLDAEEYDADVDLGEFTDEELGLSDPVVKAAPAADEEDADLDDLLDLSVEEAAAPADELTFADEEIDVPDFFDDDFKKEPAAEEEQVPEVSMDDTMIFPDKTLRTEAPAEEFQADFPEDAYGAEERYDEDEYDEEETPRRRKPSMPKINLPKITLPKIAMPNIFAKFYELYFAPLMNKGMVEEPVDPNNPRRRRRKSKVQIFKEVYLPPIIVCLTVVLVLSFVIGSVSNAIDARQAEKDKQQAALQESENAAIQEEEEYARLLKEAEVLAAGYDYEGAITLLDSFSGDIAQYQDMVAKRSEYANAQVSLVEHKDPSLIPNLSFHVLMADPERAFADEELGGSYNKNFVTVNEFTKILQQLYDNGFVLVDFDSFCVAATGVDGSVQYYVDPIYLPSGKKPVMLTQTMVNYFEYMIDSNGDHIADAGGDGFASKLVVQNGSIEAEYVDMNSETHIGNYDFVPILEDFIAEHPDFSYRGARATLAVTGYEGIFGYRCNTSYVSNVSQSYYDEQVAGAKEIVKALREKGYTLACFTYENKDYRQLSAAQITADLQQWTTQIVPIIGEVDTFVFARASNIQDYTGAAFNVMFQTGFRKFVSNGTSPWAEVNSTYIRQNRLMVTGQNMVWYSKQFTDLGLFDPNVVLDLQLRGNVPN